MEDIEYKGARTGGVYIRPPFELRSAKSATRRVWTSKFTHHPDYDALPTAQLGKLGASCEAHLAGERSYDR